MTTRSTKTRYKRTSEYQAALTVLGYTFRLNVCNERVEVNGHAIIDSEFDKIHCLMRDRGFRNTLIIDEVIRATAFDNRYHPIKEYFNRLPKHDGGEYIKQLASCFHSSDGLFEFLLRKWMIGTVAKVIEVSQNPMLIIDGPQNIGKSLFVKWLCSGMPQYFFEGPIDPDDKDSKIRLASKWIWEVSEVGATMRRSDREALKNFLTLSEVTLRRPYGKHDWTGAAMASFIGTVNNEGGILNDPTGNRRFWVTHVESIDWQLYTQMDVNLLWSEAYFAYLAGESWKLTDDERIQIDDNNEEYQVEDPIELIVMDHYRIDPTKNSYFGYSDWFEPTLAVTKLIQDSGTRLGDTALQMAIGSTLKKLGLSKARPTINGTKVSGYMGLKDKNRP